MSTFRLLLAGAFAAAVLGACQEHPDLAREAADLPTVRARLAAVEALEIPARIEIRGVVEADSSIAVSPRVSAMVTDVRVTTGDRVRRGQTLIEIDPATASGQLAQATGALAQTEASLTLAKRNLERFEALAAESGASELELDMARTQHEQARGAVEQASGAVQAARSVASESTVSAPFAGLVIRRLVDVGDLTQAGRPLILLESEHGRRLSIAVPESIASRGRLAIGDSLRVALDSRPDLGTF